MEVYMFEPILKQTQVERPDIGFLRVEVTSRANHFPISGAKITISYTGDPDSPMEQIETDSSGHTETISLPAPPIDYSLDKNSPNQPYAEYTLKVEAPGFETQYIDGTELLAEITAVQPVELSPLTTVSTPIVIPPHTLFGTYPAKMPEAEIKPVTESGDIVLSRVVVPETVVVHDGVPSDSTAANFFVPYRDYIKNVASSEIYATWPEEAITANVLAIMSFTLNRVYTEWYRGKGFDFTITSSTAFDQKFMYGRNIYDSISLVVDNVFNNYLSRPGVKQPILTQYCDGKRVTCPGWMTQWGSKSLADQGYSAEEIIRSFYGDDMYINTAEQIAGIPASWPGYELTIGVSGDKVRMLQEQLTAISKAYPAIPAVVPDGIYGPNTRESVEIFQEVFGLPVTGVVDYRTWYKISQIYVGVTRIAELQ